MYKNTFMIVASSLQAKSCKNEKAEKEGGEPARKRGRVVENLLMFRSKSGHTTWDKLLACQYIALPASKWTTVMLS